MAFLLVWRTAGPWYPNSDLRCRRIVDARALNTYSAQEASTFQVVEKPALDLASLRSYHAANADDPVGPLLFLDPADAPKRKIIMVNADPIYVPYTLAEMQAGV